MPTTLSVQPNPEVIRWARLESGYSVERVAKRLSVSVERLQAWEDGKRTPTIRQLQNLATFLHRPTGIFFLSKPPSLAPLSAEYRRLPKVVPGEESPELRLAIRQMSNRRETMLELLVELGQSTPVFDLKAHLREEPAVVASRLRDALGIEVVTQQNWGSVWQAWAAWRRAVEDLGILVFQFPSVPLDEVRGLSLLRHPLPVAAINSKESSPEARSYTLLHEVVHLMLANGQEEKPAAKESRQGKDWDEVERFAEATASHTLVPEDALQLAINNQSLPRKSWDIGDVRKLARTFSMTPLAMATRLRASGYFDWPTYHSWRKGWEAYTATLKPKKGGFASPVETTLSRAGRPFTQTVLEALSTHRIGPDVAARHLNLKFKHFDTLKGALILQPGAGGANE